MDWFDRWSKQQFDKMMDAMQVHENRWWRASKCRITLWHKWWKWYDRQHDMVHTVWIPGESHTP